MTSTQSAPVPVAPNPADQLQQQTLNVSQPNQPNVIEIFEPTYIMMPGETEQFLPSKVRQIADSIMTETLQGKTYNDEDSKEWAITIAEQLKKRIKDECNFQRYKIIVQVTIGQNKEQGVRVASRSLWDTSTDNYASVSYKNIRVE